MIMRTARRNTKEAAGRWVFRPSTGVAVFIWLALLLVVPACGNDDSQDDEPVDTPGVVSPTSPAGTTVSPGATPGGQASCETAEPRDEQQSLLVSLSDPICVARQNVAGTVDVVFRLTGESPESIQLDAGDDVAVVPDDLSPYGPNGCSTSDRAVFEATVSPPTGEPVLVELHCSVDTDPEACQDAQYVQDLVWSNTALGETCVSLRGAAGTPERFRVEITYPAIGRVFAYLVPAEAGDLLVPDDGAPGLNASPQRCMERKTFNVAVYAVDGAGAEERIGANAVVAECTGP